MKKKYNEELCFLVFDDLGLCGCGQTDATYQMIIDFLEKRNTILEGRNEDYKAFSKLLEEYQVWEEEFINKNKYYLFDYMLYMLDKNEFIDHGTSIYASWLTDKGKRLLELDKTSTYEVE